MFGFQPLPEKSSPTCCYSGLLGMVGLLGRWGGGVRESFGGSIGTVGAVGTVRMLGRRAQSLTTSNCHGEQFRWRLNVQGRNCGPAIVWRFNCERSIIVQTRTSMDETEN